MSTASSLLQCWKAGGCGAHQPPKLSAGFRRWRLWLASRKVRRAPAEEAARQLRARLQAARRLRHWSAVGAAVAARRRGLGLALRWRGWRAWRRHARGAKFEARCRQLFRSLPLTQVPRSE